jgi:hypothetical protein
MTFGSGGTRYGASTSAFLDTSAPEGNDVPAGGCVGYLQYGAISIRTGLCFFPIQKDTRLLKFEHRPIRILLALTPLYCRFSHHRLALCKVGQTEIG